MLSWWHSDGGFELIKLVVCWCKRSRLQTAPASLSLASERLGRADAHAGPAAAGSALAFRAGGGGAVPRGLPLAHQPAFSHAAAATDHRLAPPRASERRYRSTPCQHQARACGTGGAGPASPSARACSQRLGFPRVAELALSSADLARWCDEQGVELHHERMSLFRDDVLITHEQVADLLALLVSPERGPVRRARRPAPADRREDRCSQTDARGRLQPSAPGVPHGIQRHYVHALARVCADRNPGSPQPASTSTARAPRTPVRTPAEAAPLHRSSNTQRHLVATSPCAGLHPLPRRRVRHGDRATLPAQASAVDCGMAGTISPNLQRPRQTSRDLAKPPATSPNLQRPRQTSRTSPNPPRSRQTSSDLASRAAGARGRPSRRGRMLPRSPGPQPQEHSVLYSIVSIVWYIRAHLDMAEGLFVEVDVCAVLAVTLAHLDLYCTTRLYYTLLYW